MLDAHASKVWHLDNALPHEQIRLELYQGLSSPLMSLVLRKLDA